MVSSLLLKVVSRRAWRLHCCSAEGSHRYVAFHVHIWEQGHHPQRKQMFKRQSTSQNLPTSMVSEAVLRAIK